MQCKYNLQLQQIPFTTTTNKFTTTTNTVYNYNKYSLQLQQIQFNLTRNTEGCVTRPLVHFQACIDLKAAAALPAIGLSVII
jgi:hypothetical protein